MTRPLMAMLALTLTLSACGAVRESRLNPFNWFGRSEAREARQASAAERAQYRRPSDRRPLVANVTAMTVEPIPGGAILRATGVPVTQGFWEAELVRIEPGQVALDEDDPAADPAVLVFDFRVASPPFIAREGTVSSREIEVATYLTDNALDGVRQIIVRGERTERIVRR